jgi:transcriptional regulator with XRE-family HTH domain
MEKRTLYRMAWQGEKIKILSKDKSISLNTIASTLEVSRQAVHDWINGQIPKGQHLMRLSTLLEVAPAFFFSDDIHLAISVPLHRKKGVAKITATNKKEAQQLAKEYDVLFKMTDPGLVPVLRVGGISKDNAASWAQKLRQIAGIESEKPIGYDEAFTLLYRLGIVIVFRDFPVSIKSYAFYCKIHNHRVVFINTSTNVLDLIFPLLHETVHAVLDERERTLFEDEEEVFCDAVANHMQFPPAYVKTVATAIDGCAKPIQVNKIKDFSSENGHAMYGLIKLLPNLDYKKGFAGGDSNLKKNYSTIGKILFNKQEPLDYVDRLKTFTPHFVEMVAKQIGNVSERRIGEWLNLENKIDARLAIEALKPQSEGSA